MNPKQLEKVIEEVKELKKQKEQAVSNLIKHAKKELQDAGLFDKDSDYNGELGKGVLELITVFAGQGHSGYSAALTIQLFSKLANFETLTPPPLVDRP